MKTRPVVAVIPEILEYKLEYTPDLRCEKQTDLVPVCHSCKSCILSWKTFSTQEWFVRASQASQRQFLVGIIKRFKSQDLLNYTWNLLQSTNTKDFTYSRSCVSSDFASSSTMDRALAPQEVERSMANLWKWFLNAGFWTKANYILLLLQMCDAQLLLMAASLIRSLLSEDKIIISPPKVEPDEEQVEDVVFPLKGWEKSSSQVMSQIASQATGISSVFENYLPSEKSSVLGVSTLLSKSEGPSEVHWKSDLTTQILDGSLRCGVKVVRISQGNLRMQRLWSKESDQLSDLPSEDMDETSQYSIVLNDTAPVPASPQKIPNINKFKDFIRCLPIHLSKYILRMLDPKSLTKCLNVSPHWNFLVKQIKKDIVSKRSLRSEIAFLQGSCPKGAIPNYAKIVKVAIPKINEDGDIVPFRSKYKQISKSSSHSFKEYEHMQKAYHGQETDTVKLEERNVFCSSYNVRVLVDSIDPKRVVHYSGGNLLAIGSTDRKIHFLNVNDLKPLPLILYGHAGSIRAIYLNEQKGFILSGNYDLSIRMWNILTGSCMKIFNGHSGSITCLDLYKNRFVSGSKDCTAKMWSIETGKCLKTFAHKGIVWAAKINDTHVVSACDRGVVNVWHAETCILIKTLEGHLGPVKCLSFDEWHLVTGSSDCYILGWSMLGKHKRCLVAFRHPMEVLYLGFLYLRVISGCADGKIRIFNFLTGSCLRVLRANSRGDPVVSFCIAENKLLINAEGSVVLFLFEEVKWDHSQVAERQIKKKDRSKFEDLPFQKTTTLYSHSSWQRQAKKKNWKLYSKESNNTMLSYYITRTSTRGSRDTAALLYEMVKTPPPRRRENVVLEMKSEEKHKLSSFAMRQNLEGLQSVTTLRGFSDDELRSKSPAHVSSGGNAEAFIKHIRKKRPLHSMSNDQILLALGTMQHAYRNDHVSANMAFNMKIKDAWGPVPLQKDHPKVTLVLQSPMQQKKEPSTQLKELKAASGSVGMERISTPYETQTLQLNLKNSLLGSGVKSFIPAPTITRSKSCSSLLGEKKGSTGQAKIPSPPTTGVQIGHFTTSSGSIKVPQMKIARPATEVGSPRTKRFFAHTPNPYRLNAGFRLLTTQQMEKYEEAKISKCQAIQTKVIANRKKECKDAWLRKIKGLPIDDFTKENQIAAPELGEDVFICI